LLGQKLSEAEKADGSEYGGRRSKLGGTRVVPPNPPLTLAQLGVSKKESAETQQLATDMLPFLEEEARKRLTTSTGGSAPRLKQGPGRKRGRARRLKLAAASATDGIPLGMCQRCGYQGPHATAGECIDALRDRLARFE